MKNTGLTFPLHGDLFMDLQKVTEHQNVEIMPMLNFGPTF